MGQSHLQEHESNRSQMASLAISSFFPPRVNGSHLKTSFSISKKLNLSLLADNLAFSIRICSCTILHNQELDNLPFYIFSSVQLLSHVRLFAIPWTAARQAFLSITNSQSLLKLMCIKSVILMHNHLILCCPLLLLPSIFPSTRVFANELVLRIRWPKNWSFSFSISPSMNIQDWFPLGWTVWISLQSKGPWRVFSNTTVQKHQFFSAQHSSRSKSHFHTWLLEKP